MGVAPAAPCPCWGPPGTDRTDGALPSYRFWCAPLPMSALASGLVALHSASVWCYSLKKVWMAHRHHTGVWLIVVCTRIGIGLRAGSHARQLHETYMVRLARSWLVCLLRPCWHWPQGLQLQTCVAPGCVGGGVGEGWRALPTKTGRAVGVFWSLWTVVLGGGAYGSGTSRPFCAMRLASVSVAVPRNAPTGGVRAATHSQFVGACHRHMSRGMGTLPVAPRPRAAVRGVRARHPLSTWGWWVAGSRLCADQLAGTGGSACP